MHERGISVRAAGWLSAASLVVTLATAGAASATDQEVPDVMVLLGRAGHYATNYAVSFRPVIAQEHYEQQEWIRGAPRVGLSRDMRRIGSRISAPMGGRPVVFRDFHRQ